MANGGTCVLLPPFTLVRLVDLVRVEPDGVHGRLKVARSPVFSRLTNLESKLIDFFVLLNFQ